MAVETHGGMAASEYAGRMFEVLSTIPRVLKGTRRLKRVWVYILRCDRSPVEPAPISVQQVQAAPAHLWRGLAWPAASSVAATTPRTPWYRRAPSPIASRLREGWRKLAQGVLYCRSAGSTKLEGRAGGALFLRTPGKPPSKRPRGRTGFSPASARNLPEIIWKVDG